VGQNTRGYYQTPTKKNNMADDIGSVQSLAPSLSTIKWVVIIIILIILGNKFATTRRRRFKKKLNGRVVLITGSNSGIGFSTAVDFAKRNAKVILACRDKIKGERAAIRIQKMSKNMNVVFKQLDLASLSSVRAFCRAILTSESRLDILINNAGLMACPMKTTEDGFEMQFGVNYLGHFLLINLLVNLLKKSQGKIINVTSYLHKLGWINFEDLNSVKSYDPWKAYYQSKLAVVLFTQELSRRLNDSKVVANAVHPGMVATNLYQHTIFKLPGLWYLLAPVTWLMWKSAEDAASSIIYLAVSNSVEDVTGQYFSNYKVQELEPHALDEGVAKKLWDISVDLVSLTNSQI
jgi:NAD(P)-dependent dehydrogenase (short-subunit alcohol dehydrogenase family)